MTKPKSTPNAVRDMYPPFPTRSHAPDSFEVEVAPGEWHDISRTDLPTWSRRTRDDYLTDMLRNGMFATRITFTTNDRGIITESLTLADLPMFLGDLVGPSEFVTQQPVNESIYFGLYERMLARGDLDISPTDVPRAPAAGLDTDEPEEDVDHAVDANPATIDKENEEP